MSFPKGERRHKSPEIEGTTWDKCRADLSKINNLGLFSKKEMARIVGVCDRTLRRWLDNTDIPDPRYKVLIGQVYIEARNRYQKYKENRYR